MSLKSHHSSFFNFMLIKIKVKNGVRGERKRNTVQRRRNDTLCTMRSRCLLFTLSSSLFQFLITHQSSISCFCFCCYCVNWFQLVSINIASLLLLLLFIRLHIGIITNTSVIDYSNKWRVLKCSMIFLSLSLMKQHFRLLFS